MAQYDKAALGGNEDGFITADDEVWSKLSLWLDSNADGVSVDDEMWALSEYAIIQLSIEPKINNRRDAAGNSMPLWAWAEGDVKGNKKFKMVNVFFANPFGNNVALDKLFKKDL